MIIEVNGQDMASVKKIDGIIVFCWYLDLNIKVAVNIQLIITNIVMDREIGYPEQLASIIRDQR